ncbi:FUSC family protein [Variovorax sp. YR216]|uniref:FUSC family protein n=1 Tax=Variovorax sp. YR216 TaxID=1882828 RepID=UPI0008981856|nr:FUSC family protein [Variovorax sp. YR216]SEB14072.1 Fusaric acid resistance protein-like [Variovorax sp. YR216]
MTTPRPDFQEPRQVGRGESARLLLAPARIRESLSVATSPPLRNAAVAGMQVSAAVLMAVALAHFSPWAHLEGFPALGALAALFGRFAPAGRRMRIVAMAGAVLLVSVGLPTLVAHAGASTESMLLCLALLAGALTVAVTQWRIGGPGAVIFVFASSAALGPVDSWHTVVARLALTAAGAVVAWVVCHLTDGLRSETAPPVPAPGSVRPAGHWLVAAGRVAFCAGIASVLAHAAALPFPAWAAIGATAVLQGGHLHVTMHRAVQRMLGTVVGAGIAGLILANHPSFWFVLFAVVVLQFVTEVVIGFNYAFGLIFVTPMALLMTSLALPAAAAAMPMARVLDTALGALVGIAFALVFSTLDDRVHLARHHTGKHPG